MPSGAKLKPILQPLDETAVIHIERCVITVPKGYVFVDMSLPTGRKSKPKKSKKKAPKAPKVSAKKKKFPRTFEEV